MLKLKKRHIFIGIVVLVVGGGIFAATRPKTVNYTTETIDKGPVVHEISVTGSVAPLKKIVLQPEVTGRITALHVTEGSEVKAGDILVELDARDAAARVSSQRAAVDAAQAQLNQLLNGATAQELAVSAANVASAETRLSAAVAAKADAQASYDNALSRTATQGTSKTDALLVAYDNALTAAKDAVETKTIAMFTANDFLTFTTINAVAETNANSSRTTARATLVDLSNAVALAKSGTASGASSQYAAIASGMSRVKAHLDACRTVLGYTSGVSSATVTAYQANVTAASSAVDSAVSALQNAKSAFDVQGTVNASDVDTAKAALTSATFAVETAQRAVDQAKADYELKKTGARPEVIAAQRATLAAQQATLDSLHAALTKYRLVAPLDGTVTDVPMNLGETAAPGKPLVEINSHGSFEIIANVSEVDIARVVVGQAVDITLDAFPSSEHWKGKVSFIDPAEKVEQGVIFYETKFVFDQEDARIRSGMTANLAIETDRRDDVVRVPLRALKEKSGQPYVELLGTDGMPEERNIEVGVENSRYSEVTSGLSVGDKVITGSDEAK